MPRRRATEARATVRIPIHLDRDLAVSVAMQVQGQIEYGVISGDIAPGSALPSVRDLATQLGTSPVTVSAAYRALRDKGVIRAVPGRGTYVREDSRAHLQDAADDRMTRALTDLVLASERIGTPRTELVQRLNVAMMQLTDPPIPLHIVFVGVFEHVTRAYAAALRQRLRSCDTITTTTFDAVRHEPAARAGLARADLVLTFAHRAAELDALAVGDVPIATVQLVPSRRTRVDLAEIEPTETLVIVSTLPEFLPTFRRAIGNHAAHVHAVRSAVLGDPDIGSALRACDVVVYGSGADEVLDDLPAGVRAFEYRHEPDPNQVERDLRPTIEHIRAQRRRSPGST